MKFFIDTAKLDEIRSAAELGVLDGVTTNPSLIAKIVGDPQNFTFQDFKNHIAAICEVVDGPVSAEVIGQSYEEMIREGEELAAIHKNVVIKCPMTLDGLKATRYFADKGIRTNVTLVFTSNQALLAAKAGATFVSPFVGRLDDISTDGMLLVEQIVTVFDNYGFLTEVIVASVRHPQHITAASLIGADIATIPYGVIQQLLHHPLTDSGVKKFAEDAQVIKR